MIANTKTNNNWIRVLAPESKFIPFCACLVEKVKSKWLPYERHEVREELSIEDVGQILGGN